MLFISALACSTETLGFSRDIKKQAQSITLRVERCGHPNVYVANVVKSRMEQRRPR